jgi:hypothetical protein
LVLGIWCEKMARKPTDYVQFKLRVRRALLLKIQREAEKKKHSANTEAVNRLEESFDRWRDSAILDMFMDNDNVSSAALRLVADKIKKAPKSFNNAADLIASLNFSAYAKEIHERIESGEIPEDQPEGDER